MNMLNYMLIILALNFFFTTGKEPAFVSQLIDGEISIGYGLSIGDVDGDKKPDILLADKKQFVWYRNGDWKRFVMVENLTEADNVCITARDIDGDGKVEVAVGAQWNPSETSDTLKSGSVHYLIRPADPTHKWMAVKLHHEPTIHRMRWVKAADKQFHLVVLPLHGRDNKGGQGKGVKIIAYQKPENPQEKWKMTIIDESMHLTHNLDVVANGDSELIYIGGKEGIKIFSFRERKWSGQWLNQDNSFGEVRVGNQYFVTGIEPMHGNMLTVFKGIQAGSGSSLVTNFSRTILTSDLNQGHALATADLLGLGSNQIIVGWREPDKDKKVGVKMFIAEDTGGTRWKNFWIDDNGMACEDLQVFDLDGDGRKDIIAAGRSTHNLKIYWNKNKP